MSINKTGALVLFSLMLFGCSTFFKDDKPEDYNLLTYGDRYKDQGPTVAWTPQRIPASTGVLSSLRDSSRLGQPHQQEHQQDRLQYDQSNSPLYKSEPLDPTNDQVRAEIEVNRGQSVYAYERGDRATRVDFQDNKPNDGSLWSSEVDGNYFFTKGKVHALGDIISVKAESVFIKQIAEEIKKGLNPAEQEVEMALYVKNSDAAKNDQDVSAYRAVASDDLKSKDAIDVKDRMQKAARWAQVDLSPSLGMVPNEEVRAEIIDRYPNGNYKIRAVKRVLYRGTSKMVSVVGVAPASDFDEKDVIASGKLYEYKIRVAQ